MPACVGTEPYEVCPEQFGVRGEFGDAQRRTTPLALGQPQPHTYLTHQPGTEVDCLGSSYWDSPGLGSSPGHYPVRTLFEPQLGELAQKLVNVTENEGVRRGLNIIAWSQECIGESGALNQHAAGAKHTAKQMEKSVCVCVC